MEREKLEKFKEYYDNQKGQPYPCSNQTVLCGVITYDRDKALSIMEDKGAVKMVVGRDYIKWTLNNEIWTWRNWSLNSRGNRFYKIIVDENIDENLFIWMRCYCGFYCCSVEIV